MPNENVTVRAFNRGNGWQIEVTNVVGGRRRHVFGVAHNLTDRVYHDLILALESGSVLAVQMQSEDKAETPMKIKGVKR